MLCITLVARLLPMLALASTQSVLPDFHLTRHGDVKLGVAANKADGRLMPAGEALIDGALDGFLHGSNITAREVRCFEKGISLAAVTATGASRKVFAVVDTLLHPQADTESEDGGMGDMVLLLAELANGMKQLVEIEANMADHCLKRPALMRALSTAGEHLMNMTYIGGRFVANGIDIASELVNATVAFHADNWRSAGIHVGRAWRKLLLSKAGALPEGPPADEVLEEISMGLVEGFFGARLRISKSPSNFEPGLTAEVLPSRGKFLSGDGSASADEVEIDIGRCIAQNREDFQRVWTGAWGLLAGEAVEEEPLGSMMEGMPLLASTAEDFPRLLRRCNVTEEQTEMLLDAAVGLESVHLARASGRGDPLKVLNAAIRDWDAHRWHACGMDLGRVLRRSLLGILPQKYTVNEAGKLQKQLLSTVGVSGDNLGGRGGLVLLGPMAALPLLAAVAFRGLRLSSSWGCKDTAAAEPEFQRRILEGGEQAEALAME